MRKKGIESLQRGLVKQIDDVVVLFVGDTHREAKNNLEREHHCGNLRCIREAQSDLIEAQDLMAWYLNKNRFSDFNFDRRKRSGRLQFDLMTDPEEKLDILDTADLGRVEFSDPQTDNSESCWDE